MRYKNCYGSFYKYYVWLWYGQSDINIFMLIRSLFNSYSRTHSGNTMAASQCFGMHWLIEGKSCQNHKWIDNLSRKCYAWCLHFYGRCKTNNNKMLVMVLWSINFQYSITCGLFQCSLCITVIDSVWIKFQFNAFLLYKDEIGYLWVRCGLIQRMNTSILGVNKHTNVYGWIKAVFDNLPLLSRSKIQEK